MGGSAVIQHAFIIVSNRLPISVKKIDGKLEFEHSSGGLATAMSSLQLEESTWIGWPGIASDDLTVSEKRLITKKLQEHNCVPVFLTQQQVSDYYDGYANGTLWPLLHYFQYQTVYDPAWWHAYQKVNALFAAAATRNAMPDAKVWIHDYHLLLLPQLIRASLPDANIGFFLHTPFPSYEIFRLLPNRSELLEGMLGADLIGFHTFDYARHFTSSVLRALGYSSKHEIINLPNRTVTADAFPIGIDYDKFTDTLASTDTTNEIAHLRSHYKGQKIILSVDRLDYSKGIPERLEAFNAFLEKHPEYHKKVTLVVVAVPSRVDVEAYRQLREQVEQMISRINGAFGTVDWAPISYQFQNLPLHQLVALYAISDIALVTPLRDGMNLVAKEYIASKQKQPGVLILSEVAGAASELPEAHVISPNDRQAIVKALESAMKQPLHIQTKALEAMQARIKIYDVRRWAADFVEQLMYAHEYAHSQTGLPVDTKQLETITKAFKGAKRRLLFLDYDGTLRNFVKSPDPNEAAPDEQLLATLRTLASKPHTEVCIISGRPREALEQWFGPLPLTLIAEHGAWIRRHGEWAQTDIDFEPHRRLLMPILQNYAERTPGAVIEQKSFSLVWHYRNVMPELAYARNASIRHAVSKVVDTNEIATFHGNKILEIKPRDIHKGAIVEELVAETEADFVLCAGDDYTDEHMFEVLPENAYSIKVGSGESKALYRINSVENMLDILSTLSKAR